MGGELPPCELYLRHVCAHTTICVLILLYMCPRTTIYVASHNECASVQVEHLAYARALYYYLRLTTMHVSSDSHVCVRMQVSSRPLLTYELSIRVLRLLYTCPQTRMYCAHAGEQQAEADL